MGPSDQGRSHRGGELGINCFCAANLGARLLARWVEQTSSERASMSALPPIADIGGLSSNDRYVPQADMSATSAALITVPAGALKRCSQAWDLCQLELGI